MPAHNPGERRQQARLAAITRWSREDPHDPNGPLPRARAAFEARFYEGIPENLPQAERDRRAACARRAHFLRMALRSAQARRRNAADSSTSDGAA